MDIFQSRTHNCGELRIKDIGKEVLLAGWMENFREVGQNLGFIVLRDFYGTTQIVIENEEMMKTVKTIIKESVISVTGLVRERASKNLNIPTGEIEIVPHKITVLGKCRYKELPFEINRSKEADESVRLKYRYLDLRNPSVKKNIILRSEVIAALRKSMIEHGFLEITTPILTASSPEGARDYLVPARKHPGKFYALPQARNNSNNCLWLQVLTDISRLLHVFAMKMHVGIALQGNFINLTWRWHLRLRKMYFLS